MLKYYHPVIHVYLQRPLPVKWMAIESLKALEYTHKSDMLVSMNVTCQGHTKGGFQGFQENLFVNGS